MTRYLIFALIIGGIALFIYFRVRKNFKFINLPSVSLFTGGCKTGKTELGVAETIKNFRAVHRRWSINKFICKVFRKKFDTEEPYIYTNGWLTFGNGKRPHKLDYCIKVLPLETLLRLERYNYKSIIFIQEASLLSDNMDFNDLDRNCDLSLWSKLIAHETRGGKLILDTQSPKDLSYPLKRVMSSYYFIQKRVDFWLFAILYVRELVNEEIGASNNFTDDVDTTTRKIFLGRWWYKHYDRYEFSYLTDCLKASNQPLVRHKELVSFNPRYRERADKRPKEVKENVVR